jgi:histone-lysine N-methyltransferase MLL1
VSYAQTLKLKIITVLCVTGNPSLPGTVVCGVCGAVRFYRFVKQARKFGIFSCESCRKFVSKMMKRQACSKGGNLSVLECHKGAGEEFYKEC